MTHITLRKTMKRLATILITLSLLVTALPAAAQSGAPSITTMVKAQVVQGQRFTVTYRLTNAEARISSAPQLKNCSLIYGPALSTMSYTSITNGRTESVTTVDYTFTYTADKAGQVTIPAMTVNAGGKRITAAARTFTILPPDKAAQARQHAGENARAASHTGRQLKASANDLIVTVTLSKNSIYEQEAVIATIKVYTKFNIISFRATTLPNFDGFLSEELPTSATFSMEHFRGDNYYVAELKRCLLYPQKSGKLTINSGRYDVTLEAYEEISNGFFVERRPFEQHITTSSNSLTVNVKDLPQPRPADFSGAVGTNFNVSASLEPKTLRTNEAATYTYTVNGTGNIKYLSAPDIDFGNNVEEYDPETDAEATFNGSNMTGKFTAVYTVVPQQVGEMTVPAGKFVYFNPTTSKYVTIDIPAITRKIAKGSGTVSGVPQKAIAKKIDDILHIKVLSPDDLEHEPDTAFGSLLYTLCYIIVIVALTTAAIVYRRNLKLNADVTGRRMARANRVATKRLRLALREMQQHHDEAFHAAVASALWGYMGDKLRIPASALTRDNITEKLTDDGVSPELTKQTIDVLDDCEMARFTPGNADTKMSDLYKRAADVINALESSKRKK